MALFIVRDRSIRLIFGILFKFTLSTSREKEISIKEKAIKEKEKELNEVTLKLASAQTYILNLEKRINDMESSILYKKTGGSYLSSHYRFEFVYSLYSVLPHICL
jgi:NADH:ubiquinone oxidoreductase subunit C